MDNTFAISGMHCGRCLGKIKLALTPFADAVDVSISPQRATLQNMRQGATLEDMQAAIATIGPYTISPLRNHATAAPEPAVSDDERPWFETYWPLLVIVGYITVASYAGAGSPSETRLDAWMANFMAGFFLVFSAFKFLDVRGFADAYASYDLLAKRWHGYGFIYPFLELALGLAYLYRFEPQATHVATIALMSFSALGVIDALNNRRAIQCACLGTALKLPMSTITLVEDVGMALMAVFMVLT